MSDDAGRILVVDDVPENVRLLEAVLDAHGYDDRLGHGQPGCSRPCPVGEARPRAARRDDAAPRRLAVCRRLREQEETAVLPVIMLTASEGSEKTTAIEAGADDFLSKPFNREELLTASGRCSGSSATTTRSRLRLRSCSS